MKNIYRHIAQSQTSLNSADEFINKIKEMKIEKCNILVSSDVVNVYLTTDKNEIMAIVNSKIKEKYRKIRLH